MPDLPHDTQWLPRLPLDEATALWEEDDLPTDAGGLPDGVRVVQAVPLLDEELDEAPWI